MLRNVFLVLVLTALTATSALASPGHRAKAAHQHASKNESARSSKHSKTRASRTHERAAQPAPARAAAREDAEPTSARGLRRLRHQAVEPRTGRRHSGARLERASLSRRGFVIPPTPLKGSLESLTRQNTMSEAEGLERILDEDDLADRINQGLLVRVPVSSELVISDALPENHRYCRPWTADFLAELAQAHQAEFRHSLYVSSAVRTVEYQKRLMRRNGNAAAAEGDIVSPHLTGATIDIAKQGMSRKELKWMRDWLLPLQNEGKIDVEEEFRQSCFHITVYKSFGQPEQAAPSSPSSAPESDSSHGV